MAQAGYHQSSYQNYVQEVYRPTTECLPNIADNLAIGEVASVLARPS
jgi:hypothetical protein